MISDVATDKPALREVNPTSSNVPDVLDESVEQVIEPLSLSTLGKLFGVPLIIIATIVGGAVAVVLLFGAPTMPERRSAESLLLTLESNSGERSLGILLPREKELWQTALELVERLTKQGEEFTQEELTSLADRLSVLVKSDLATLDNLATVGAERLNHQHVRSRRLEFTIRALGRTQQPAALVGLIDVVKTGHEPYVSVAMREIGDLHHMPESREAIAPILDLLKNAVHDETKLVAVTVLSVLAEPGDVTVLDALNRARVTQEGEVSWASALALARLGSEAGKTTLLDLLDREFWEKEDRYRKADASGVIHRYKMPAARVDEWLISAIDAVRNLHDAGVWESIADLTNDSSLSVRAKAKEAIEQKAVAVTARG